MLIDLHIHSKSSDGALPFTKVIREAERRRIGLMSITDHDSIKWQKVAADVADEAGIRYISGVELNVTYSHPGNRKGKNVSLDFLGYQFDVANKVLKAKLEQMAEYRKERAKKILSKLNVELEKKGIQKLTERDFEEIQASVDVTFGRQHIGDYLVRKGIVENRQEAFTRYLVKCNVPKFPLYLEDASNLVRDAGGKLVLAHPNDPLGTSLVTLTKSLSEQTRIIKENMLVHIDGIECWHSRNDTQTTEHYVKFAKNQGLIMTGGSDCHQKPIIMGTVKIPEFVASQF